MNPYTKTLRSQLAYLKKIFDRRKDEPEELMPKEIDFQSNSPLSVIAHAINNLNYYSDIKFDLMSDLDYVDLFEEINEPVYDLILKNYEKSITKFQELIDSNILTEDHFNDQVPYLTMHTIQHIGQGCDYIK